MRQLYELGQASQLLPMLPSRLCDDYRSGGYPCTYAPVTRFFYSTPQGLPLPPIPDNLKGASLYIRQLRSASPAGRRRHALVEESRSQLISFPVALNQIPAPNNTILFDG